MVKNPPCNARDMGSVPGQGRSHMLRGNEPHGHNFWAHTWQLLKPSHLEPVFCNPRSHCNEKSAHDNERKPSHGKKTQHSQRKNRNRRDCKRTSWNHRMSLLTLFIQLRKTAVMGKGLVKTTIFSAILRPIKRNQIPWIQPPNPRRERRLGMQWLQSSPGRYFPFSKSSLHPICTLGHQKNVGHT